MVNNGGGTEGEQRPSILKNLFARHKDTPQAGPIATPPSVDDRLQQIGSESFSYTPNQLRLAKENSYDLSTGQGKADFASFLGRYYSPKDASVPQSEKEVHRVAKPNGKLQFTMVDNTGPMK